MNSDQRNENEISRDIVESAIELHRTLGGPGLLESVYEEALVWELEKRGLAVRRQVQLPIPYKGHTLASPLRIDLMVATRSSSSARRSHYTMPFLKHRC